MSLEQPTIESETSPADPLTGAPEEASEPRIEEVMPPDEPSAVVAIPGSLHQDRPSFWRRIRLRSRSGLRAATGDDRMLARLDSIESRLESSERELGERIQHLDERFTQVWEVEEQLSRLMELQEVLTDVRDRQAGIEGRLRGIGRRLSLVSVLAATAAMAGLLALAVAFV
jgi:hypothetical protein